MRLGFKEHERHWKQGKIRCVRISDVPICSGRRLHTESDVTRCQGVGFFFFPGMFRSPATGTKNASS